MIRPRISDRFTRIPPVFRLAAGLVTVVAAAIRLDACHETVELIHTDHAGERLRQSQAVVFGLLDRQQKHLWGERRIVARLVCVASPTQPGRRDGSPGGSAAIDALQLSLDLVVTEV